MGLAHKFSLTSTWTSVHVALVAGAVVKSPPLLSTADSRFRKSAIKLDSGLEKPTDHGTTNTRLHSSLQYPLCHSKLHTLTEKAVI